MSQITEQDLIDHAEDEAKDVASCLWKYRQLHESCSWCNSKSFCDYLKETLDSWLSEEKEVILHKQRNVKSHESEPKEDLK